MIQFFNSIGNVIKAIFQSFVWLFQQIPFVLDSVQAALDSAGLFFALPAFISGIACVTLVVAIVLLILRILHG